MVYSKADYIEKVEKFKEEVGTLESKGLLVVSVQEFRRALIERDGELRSLLRGIISSPPLTYIIRGGVLTVSRHSNRVGYKDFSFRYSLKGLLDLDGAYSFQSKVFLKLLEEGVYLENLSKVNNFLEQVTSSYGAPYRVLFTPPTFSDKYVEFISDEFLILSGDEESCFTLVSKLAESDITSILDEEFNALSICQSTVEVLYRKSSIITYLLNSGKLGLVKLLRPVYNKTTKQLKTYQTGQGYGYYLNDNVYGVVERTEFSNHIILEPINLITFERDLSVDLLKEVE